MKFHRRARIAVLLVPALLAGLPGVLAAACGPVCPSAARAVTGHGCCHPAAVPTLRAGSCCDTVQAAAPTEAAPAVGPLSPTAFVLALIAPLALPAEPLAEQPDLPPAGPPPLHEGIGLYTLNSVFLI